MNIYFGSGDKNDGSLQCRRGVRGPLPGSLVRKARTATAEKPGEQALELAAYVRARGASSGPRDDCGRTYRPAMPGVRSSGTDAFGRNEI